MWYYKFGSLNMNSLAPDPRSILFFGSNLLTKLWIGMFSFHHFLFTYRRVTKDHQFGIERMVLHQQRFSGMQPIILVSVCAWCFVSHDLEENSHSKTSNVCISVGECVQPT